MSCGRVGGEAAGEEEVVVEVVEAEIKLGDAACDSSCDVWIFR